MTETEAREDSKNRVRTYIYNNNRKPEEKNITHEMALISQQFLQDSIEMNQDKTESPAWRRTVSETKIISLKWLYSSVFLIYATIAFSSLGGLLGEMSETKFRHK